MDIVPWSNIDCPRVVGGLSPAICLNEKNMTHHYAPLQLIYYLMARRNLMFSCVTPHSFCACHPENQCHSVLGQGLASE